MDKIPPSGEESKKIIFRASALLLLVMTVFLFAHFRSERAATNVEESIMKVERKDFAQSLRLNGTTQASRSFVVLAPRLEGAQVGSMVITKLAPAGTHVEKGDVLVEFDPQAEARDYLDKKSTYENLVGQVAQKQADENIARAKDDTAMQQAEDELKRAQLELQKNEIVSRIDAEKNQEAVDEAQSTLKQLKETYQLKRAAATAAIRILEIQRDRALEPCVTRKETPRKWWFTRRCRESSSTTPSGWAAAWEPCSRATKCGLAFRSCRSWILLEWRSAFSSTR